MRSRAFRYVSRHGVAFLALMVAMGGTAFAAATVGGSDLKPYTISEASKTIKPGKSKIITAKCSGEERFISGGYVLSSAKPAKAKFGFQTPFILDDDGGVPGYQVEVKNARKNGKLTVFVDAVCLSA